jgi:endoglucanase
MINAQTSNWDIVQDMGRGINMGNTLSAPVEGNWAPSVHEQYFIDVAEAGFNNVRIPVDFFGSRTDGQTVQWSSAANTASQYDGGIDDFTVSSLYLDRVEDVINWSLNQGLYTVLDFHGAELKSEFLQTFNNSNSNYTHPSSSKRAADLMKFKSIWTQIAYRFIDHPMELIFEVVNEPYFEVNDVDMNFINMMIIEAIRATGGNNSTRQIIITGGSSTSYQAPTSISNEVLSYDPNLIASFHYYMPFNFTASSQEQYNDFNWGTNADKSTVDSHFNTVKNWSETNNIPVTLGEFGADNESGYNYNTGLYGNNGGPVNSSRVEYHRYIAEQAINRGFSFSAWCAGNKSTKTIHLRTDNPETNNIYPGVWVEDVKNALLSDGEWPTCYGPYNDEIIRNSDFECGISSQWSFSVQGSAEAFLDETENVVYSGQTAAKIEVTSAQGYNKVLLSNVVYDGDLNNKTLIIGCHAKSNTENISFKMRIKSLVDGDLIFVPSQAYELSNTFQYYQFEYVVPDLTENIQLQIMTGAFEGSYFLDTFDVQVVDTSLNSSDYNLPYISLLYPNPTSSKINVKSDKSISRLRVFDIFGRIVMKTTQTQNINIEKFNPGIYSVELMFLDGSFTTQKIIKY